MQNHYDILGVPFTASTEEIKSVYKKLAVKYHPDKHGGDKYYEEQFKKISAAYHVLSNPARRRRYDLKVLYGSRPTANPQRPQKAQASSPPPAATPRPRPAKKMDKRTERKYLFYILSGLFIFLSIVVTAKITTDNYFAEKTYKEALKLESEELEMQALEKYLLTLEYDESYGPAYEKLGDFKLRNNEEEWALKFYYEALKHLENPSSELFVKISRLEFNKQNYKQSLQFAEKAIKKDSSSTAALYERSLSRFFTGNFNGCSQDLNHLIEKDKNSWRYHYLRGKARINLQDTSGACSDWAKAKLYGMNAAEGYLLEYCVGY